jgi:hypothetical protein
VGRTAGRTVLLIEQTFEEAHVRVVSQKYCVLTSLTLLQAVFMGLIVEGSFLSLRE